MGGNYERSLHKQLVEQIELNEVLREENNALRLENSRLKKEVKRLQSKIDDMESTMTDKIAACVEEAVRLATAPLLEELNKAHTEISRLKAIINKDSSNSSKPPSTNGFKTIPNSREKSTKPQGGQKGHPGSRLRLPENIDELEKQGKVERRVKDHTDGNSEYVSKYTIDLEMKVVVTEHRFRKGETAEGLHNEVSYGDNIKAQILLLMNEGIVPYERLSGIISEMTHGIVNLSTGTMNKFQSDFADQLNKSGEIEAIKQNLLNTEVLHTDDTGLRVLERIVFPEDEGSLESVGFERGEKKSLRATVRTYSSETATLYTVNPKKDKKGIERDGILPLYTGILCSDHESKFLGYGKKNAVCGAHLTRNLKGLSDSYDCPWAMSMRRFVLGMNEHKIEDMNLGATACSPEKLAAFEDEYDRLLDEGRKVYSAMKEGAWGSSELNAMLNRLKGSKDNYMLFMHNYKVPFTNNLAERDLRSEKIKEKVSGLFRSWKGIEDHSKTNSFISTLKKSGKNLFAAIKQVIKSEPVFVQ